MLHESNWNFWKVIGFESNFKNPNFILEVIYTETVGMYEDQDGKK